MSFSPGGKINNSGVIFAPDGQIHLAVGDKMTLHLSDATELEIVIDEALQTQLDALNASIENSGALSAKSVSVQAALNNSLVASAVNNSGLIEAHTMSNEGGSIRIFGASTEGAAVVSNTGLINASGDDRAGVISIRGDINYNSGVLVARSENQGGHIEQLGHSVINESGIIDVSGWKGGGTALIGGDFQGHGTVENAQQNTADENTLVLADAGESGDGGKVIFWSDGVTSNHARVFARGGDNSGNGGFAEISGKDYLDFRGQVDLTAANGNKGDLLLDPDSILITDWSPTDITGLTSWFDANTNYGANNSTVSTWYDLSGNDNNVTGTATLKTNDVNGNNSVYFNGSQKMQTAGNYSITGNTNRSVFVVFNQTGGSTANVMGWGSANTVKAFDTLLYGGAIYENFYGSVENSTGKAFSKNTWYRYDGVYNSGTYSDWLNGTAITPVSFSINTQASPFYIGDGGANVFGSLTGKVAEVLVYNRALTTTQRQSVENNLTAKWTTPNQTIIERGQITNLSRQANVSLQATNDITIQNMATTGGVLALTGSGRSLTLNAGGSIVMQNTSNTIRTEGGNISFTSGGGMTLGNLNTTGAAGTLNTGNITLNAGGSITTGTLDVNTGSINVTTTSGGNFGSSGSPIATDASTLVLNTAGNAYMSNARAVTVNGSAVGGNFQLRNSGSGNITVNNLDVTGTTDIQTLANSNSDISGSGNIFRSTATINSNDNSGGDISISGDFRGNTSLTGDRITVSDTAGNFTVTSLNTGSTGSTNTLAANAGNLTLSGITLDSTGATAGGRLDASANGSVSINGSGWNSTNDVLNAWSSGSGSMTLSNASLSNGLTGSTGTTNPNQSGTGVYLRTNGSYTLTSNSVSGNTTIDANNTITGTGNTFTGSTDFDANQGTAYNISLTGSDFQNGTNTFDGANVTVSDTNALSVSGITTTGTGSLTAAGGTGNTLTVSNAAINGATTLTSSGGITATSNNALGTLTLSANGTVDLYETDDININSVTNNSASAATTLYSTTGGVVGKGTAVADIVSAGSGQVAIVGGTTSANTGGYVSVNVNTGGPVIAVSTGKNGSNTAVKVVGTVGGNLTAMGIYIPSLSFVPAVGNIILGDYTTSISVGGTTTFLGNTSTDVTGAGSFSGAVGGTAARVGIESLTGNFTSSGITATGSTGWYGAADETLIVQTRAGDILGSGYTASGAGNIRLQAGTSSSLNAANNISVANVNAGQNLALYATAANAGNSVTVSSGSVGGYVTATGLNASNNRSALTGGVDITLSSGNLTTASVWSGAGAVNLTASNGSILQNATVYSGMNGKTIRAAGDVTLSANGGSGSYIDTGVLALGSGSDVTARASGKSGGNVSVNLIGRTDGNISVTNQSSGNVTGAVNLGSITLLDDVTTIFDVGGNTTVKATGAVNLHGGFGIYNGTLTANGSSVTGRFDKGTTLNLSSVTASGGDIDLRTYNAAHIIGGNLSGQNIYLQAGSQWMRDKLSYVNLSNTNASGNLTVVVVGSDTGTSSGNAVTVTGSVGGSTTVTNESGGATRGNVSTP